MKIVATSLLCLCFLGSAIAAPTNDHGKDKDKKEKQHKVKDEKKPEDQGKPAANNGKHLGWYKNPHNPHYQGNSGTTTASTGSTTGNPRPGATTSNPRPGATTQSAPSGPISKPGETTVWPGHPAPGST